MHRKSYSSAAPALVCLILSFFCLGGAIAPAAAWDKTLLRRMVLSPDGQQIYAVNPFSAGVSVIDAATHQIVRTLTFRHLNDGLPSVLAISPDGAQLYGADPAHNQLEIISVALGRVVAWVKVDKNPTALAVSPDGGRVYVLNEGSSTVSVIDPKADQVVATIPFDGNHPGDMALQPDGSRLYVSLTNAIPGLPQTALSGKVAVIDTAKNRVTSSLRVGNHPQSLAISPDGQRLYVAHSDPTSRQIDIIKLHGQAREGGLIGGYSAAAAVSPDGKRLYILSSEFNLLLALDTTNSQVLAATPPANQPYALATSPDGHRLYLFDLGARSISVLDATTLQREAAINLAPAPAGRP
jgi:YVTN family beta-propeller protein